MTESWRNWAGNEEVRPARVRRPGSSAEVAQAVRDAVLDGQRVKAVGAGHSFSPVAVAPGVQLRLDRMDGLYAVDRASGLVTVEAGMPLWKLGPLLAEHSLALETTGDIDPHEAPFLGAADHRARRTGDVHPGVDRPLPERLRLTSRSTLPQG
ncbi:FAD-binding protein [Streptomyces sp. CLV115]|uniref:FAD-binding protein n=1 Tax=Streptomyces sp. CLV115 TaxID=3138502 RepID=UPI00313D4B27